MMNKIVRFVLRCEKSIVELKSQNSHNLKLFVEFANANPDLIHYLKYDEVWYCLQYRGNYVQISLQIAIIFDHAFRHTAKAFNSKEQYIPEPVVIRQLFCNTIIIICYVRISGKKRQLLLSRNPCVFTINDFCFVFITILKPGHILSYIVLLKFHKLLSGDNVK